MPVALLLWGSGTLQVGMWVFFVGEYTRRTKGAPDCGQLPKQHDHIWEAADRLKIQASLDQSDCCSAYQCKLRESIMLIVGCACVYRYSVKMVPSPPKVVVVCVLEIAKRELRWLLHVLDCNCSQDLGHLTNTILINPTNCSLKAHLLPKQHKLCSNSSQQLLCKTYTASQCAREVVNVPSASKSVGGSLIGVGESGGRDELRGWVTEQKQMGGWL